MTPLLALAWLPTLGLPLKRSAGALCFSGLDLLSSSASVMLPIFGGWPSMSYAEIYSCGWSLPPGCTTCWPKVRRIRLSTVASVEPIFRSRTTFRRIEFASSCAWIEPICRLDRSIEWSGYDWVSTCFASASFASGRS